MIIPPPINIISSFEDIDINALPLWAQIVVIGIIVIAIGFFVILIIKISKIKS
jgi:hypothetical protein